MDVADGAGDDCYGAVDDGGGDGLGVHVCSHQVVVEIRGELAGGLLPQRHLSHA